MFAPIAIVGRACVLPGALSPDALWEAVIQGRDLLSSCDEGRWRRPKADALVGPDGDTTDKAWTDRGGYVRGFEGIWDPRGFAVEASELAGLDPVALWTLHCAREALRDAGDHRGGAVDRSRTTGVFGLLGYPSASMTAYVEGVHDGTGSGDPRNRFMAGGTAALVQRALGLAPDAFCLDTACASSLYALKLACDRLHDGTADLALAGAVSCSDDLFIHVGFTALQALSKTGQSRPFHADADGLVPAEGAGVLALKRLEDAIRDGDTIHGILRGIGLSNDGRARGFLAPAAEGQERSMASAWTGSGLSPRQATLLECHATGTTVGDATELASSGAVFAGHEGLPLGSLKSNLGHLITAAGVAGIIKVIEAMRHGVRPPTLHTDAPNPALDGSPFRLLRAPEAWEGPRIAGVSAFGFGGNNGHVVLTSADVAAPSVSRERTTSPLHIAGVGAVVGTASTADELLAGPAAPRTGAFELDLAGLRFPPTDLKTTLPQQLLVLKAAREAVAGLDLPAQTGVWVAMEPDVEVARYGTRWRRPDVDKDAVVEPLSPAGVVGRMPNIPANRLNAALDLRGPGMSVFNGSASGGRVIELASRALRAGEVDAAIVCAVDLCSTDAHARAADAVFGAATPGDAAVALVLRRAEDAPTAVAALEPAPSGHPVRLDDRLGRAGAAGELRDFVLTALLMERGDTPDTLDVAFEAAPAVRLLRAPPRAPRAPRTPTRPLRFEAHPPPLHLPRPEPTMQTMPPAPTLRPVLNAPEAPTRSPAAPPTPAAPPVPATHVVVGDPAAAAVQRTLQNLGQLHRNFLEQQALVHARFLASQQTAMSALGATPSTGAPPVVAAPPAPRAAPAPAPVTVPTPAPAVQPPAPVAAPTPRPAPPVVEVAPPPSAARAPIGPTFDFEQLKTHASGRISDIFGPMFSVQDDHARQVRMPEPPLLLADRVTGLDAEPGSMGKGVIWTESDVEAERWFMHQGHMPLGILIESGQADLMLISYLGVDFTNRGERCYRLLGCELTLRGGLPAPGETLEYQIHLDGHAKQGDVRLMFFHYDCRVDGNTRLEVRKGQAGFFTDQELADSDGCLWTPEGQEIVEPPRLSPPVRTPNFSAFTAAQAQAFADGRPWECFGPGWERTQPHTRTPRIQNGRMFFLEGGVDTLEHRGGPWKRGYLKSTVAIRPDHWFFEGHFKNDSCMPGTLMLEGCLQHMAFYLASMGFTIDRDGWRFEPTQDEPFLLSCRGQVTPTSRVLTYEVFVEEVTDAPQPTVWADVLCTVDGLKAFHARRLGVQLVPGWPLDEGNAFLDGYVEPKPVADADGFAFDQRSLIACANGMPSEAFGPMYTPFDSPIRVARLPNPPYLFLSRVTDTQGDIGSMTAGLSVVTEFDVDPQAWYFDENGCRTMPFAVLLEAALQPCGWLASYAGCALALPGEAFFRNLDGTGTLHVDVLPDSGTFRSEVTLTNISHAGSMIIVNFDVACTVDGAPVYDLKTVFGFFPGAALANQIGLPTTDSQRALLEGPSSFGPLDLTQRPARYWDTAALAEPMLLMIDRITAFEPAGGSAGLGFARSEKDVDPGEWFFKAHFFQDPVQPGSLGIEAMIQVLQWMMLELGLDEGIDQPRFEALGLGQEMTWKYRGQVVPENQVISATVEITERGTDERGAFAVSDCSLWVDGKRIYEATGLGMRIVSGGTPARAPITLDPAVDPWLLDHCPTYTRPALPMMSVVDLLAQGATLADPVTTLHDVALRGWIDVGEARTFDLDRQGDRITLRGSDGAERASARVATGAYPARPTPLPPLDGPAADSPYTTGALFHGPAFQVLESLIITPEGSSSVLRATSEVPVGRLNAALLDGATHGIPHDDLGRWGYAAEGKVAYPARITEMTFFGPTPTAGTVRCEVRPDGTLGTPDLPAFRVQLVDEFGVWCEFRLIEACFPKGRLGSADPGDRQRFLRDREFVSGLTLSDVSDSQTTLDPADVDASDWLPGTIEAVFSDREPEAIAFREHVAHAHGIHPGRVLESLPLTRWDLTTEGTTVTGDARGSLDLSSIEAFWDRWFGMGRWPVEDLYYGLIQRFVRRVVLDDPAAFAAVRGRSCLFLANHQTGVESLVFSILASALLEVPTVTLAKIEHQTTWLGRLIAHCFSYPDVRDPKLITFFDRTDKSSLPRIIGELAQEMTTTGRGVMVHVEGTRSFECRTPVQKMSGAFTDMALATNAPIVPVRFAGGLPIAPLEARTEFPVGMGQQDVWFGRPILPEELSSLDYGARKRVVIDAINGLGPAEDAPLPGDPAFAARVAAWQTAHPGADEEHAALACILGEREGITADSARILDPSDALDDDAWLRELGRRLRG